MAQEEVEEIRKNYPMTGKMYKTLGQCGYSKEELAEYLRYDMKDDEIATGLRDAKRAGVAEGIAAGELNTKRETAISLLSKGMSVEDIADVTGLPLLRRDPTPNTRLIVLAQDATFAQRRHHKS
jgi:predicted transposase/invertase (TIGR01784 family)